MGPEHNREVPQLYSSLINQLHLSRGDHAGPHWQSKSDRCYTPSGMLAFSVTVCNGDKRAGKKANVRTVWAVMGERTPHPGARVGR